jgi:UDP-glucose 4-epimerase
MKILVTGGAGYIGSHTVVELVNAGYEPVIVDNFCNSHEEVIDRLKVVAGTEIVCHEGDCCDLDFMERVFDAEKNIEGVIHFAALKSVAESMQKPEVYRSNNIGSLDVVMDLMRRYETAFLVFSSSACVYGAADILPVTEGTPLKEPESVYGETKKKCEDMIEQAVLSGLRFNAVSLRYFNPIGAHASAMIGELPIGVPNNLVPFITQTASGNLPYLTVFGDDYLTPDGTAVRDYIHVVDLAQAHVRALEYLRGRSEIDRGGLYDVFNLGTGQGSSVLEVIGQFEKVSGVKLNYRVGHRRPGDVPSLYADCSKAERLMGWKAALTLEDGLRDAWNWQKKMDSGELIHDNWRITMESWRRVA